MKLPFYRCAHCGYDFTVTAGTLFADTHKPLRLWFEAIWYVTNQKSGASALGVQRILGLGSYRTAWNWMHKLRRAMVRPGRDRLAGLVEVDETFIGGPRPGKRGRGAANKTLVLIAAQADGRKIGRIRLARITDASAASLEPAVRQAIEPGTRIQTDDWSGYSRLRVLGYDHEVIQPTPNWDTTCCPGSTSSPPCLSDGCWAPTKEQCGLRTWTTTWTSSPFDSTAALRARAGCSSTACCSKRSRCRP